MGELSKIDDPPQGQRDFHIDEVKSLLASRAHGAGLQDGAGCSCCIKG